jgi:hypothetical protein
LILLCGREVRAVKAIDVAYDDENAVKISRTKNVEGHQTFFVLDIFTAFSSS